MRLEKYTYDARKCGQGAKRRARTLRERTGIQNPLKSLRFQWRAKRLYARACDEGGREGYLKVKAAGIGVNVHNLAREIQPCDQL